MAKPKLGSGARFRAMEKSGKSAALSAWIGRKRYGKDHFQKLATKGRKKHAAK